MDTACFFVGKPKSTAERIWKASGWNAKHVLETLKDKCLVEEIKYWSLFKEETIILGMHDHLRDLGREMALELSPPHRLWRPLDLESLKSMRFKTILTKINVRCFSSIFDESMGSQVTFFLGQSDSCLETSAFLPWLELEGNSKEQPSIPSWIPLQNLHCLKIRFGQLKTLWDNRIQAPSQLKELQISQTSLKEFPDILGISNNLENVFLDARGLPIQGLSLLESLRMNLSSLCLRVCTLKGEQASTKRGERTLSESLVIENFKFNGELDWNNGEAPMSGLEKLEINHEEFVSKILISGIHYPSLQSIKLHYMENLMEVDLTRVNTLRSLDIGNCKKLKRLAATSDLPNLRNSTSVAGIPDLRNLAGSMVKDCTDLVAVDHFNSVSGVSSFRMLAQLKISECPELEELRLGHLSCLENITIEDCNHLKYLCFSGMKCLESMTFERNVMVKYFELDDCEKLKTMLRELTIRECPELEELPCLSRVNAMEKIEIQSCEKIQNIRLPTTLISLFVESCRDLQTLAGTGDLLELRELTIRKCPELEELRCLSRVNAMEKIVIDSCEKIQKIRLPTKLISLSVHRCRDFRTFEGTGDILELRNLIIRNCPELEELPNLSRISSIEEIVIDSCEKLQNIAGIEELHASEYMKLSYCSSALIRNCIHKLKRVPSREMNVIGRAADGAASSLNENLFCEGNIGVEGVTEIGICKYDPVILTEPAAHIVCFLVVVDSSRVRHINDSLAEYNWCYDIDCQFDFEVREGEWIITMVACDDWSRGFILRVLDVLRSRGEVKKGFRVEVKVGEEWKIKQVLSTIVDRLYHS